MLALDFLERSRPRRLFGQAKTGTARIEVAGTDDSTPRPDFGLLGLEAGLEHGFDPVHCANGCVDDTGPARWQGE